MSSRRSPSHLCCRHPRGRGGRLLSCSVVVVLGVGKGGEQLVNRPQHFEFSGQAAVAVAAAVLAAAAAAARDLWKCWGLNVMCPILQVRLSLPSRLAKGNLSKAVCPGWICNVIRNLRLYTARSSCKPSHIDCFWCACHELQMPD